ncbi:murein L,D-transpeptidase catalytic domain family protein [Sphingobium aquiterrae]|uniref:murein L,D-transpeptidase catalytic domain family protein n=1 Tax=Sphingobium aquiterrae TaxID=2038656 RepID=UPI00301A04D0
MDRRAFTRFALTGLGAALFPASLCRAALLAPGGQSLLPGTSPLPGSVPYQALLERARAALDRHQGRIALRDRVGLADFSAASKDLRFHIVDLEGGKATSYLVAHGRGSDPEHSGWLRSFSNDMGSFATSDGAYVTSEVYEGQHGQSMRLIGLDPQNNNAEARAIVIHGADYVSENFLVQWGKLGRSEGCFALAQHMVPTVLGQLGNGRLLYADKVQLSQA